MSLVPVLSVIVIVIISLLVTKIATSMLVNTGLSRHSARFQARSAFTGVGFTTTESEQITSHPSRRKIISSLMLLGNAGIVTVMASLLLTFMHKDEQGLPWYYGIIMLVGAIIILALMGSSNKVDKTLTLLIDRVLQKFKNISSRDYSTLYKLADGYRVADLYIPKESWMAGKNITDAEIASLGIIILGIEKPNGTFIGKLSSDTVIHPNDLMIIYGNESVLKGLNVRRSSKN